MDRKQARYPVMAAFMTSADLWLRATSEARRRKQSRSAFVRDAVVTELEKTKRRDRQGKENRAPLID